MFMEVDDKVKIAYYWFSKEEKDDKELRRRNANNRGNLSSIILRKKRARGSIDVIRSCTQGRAQQPLTPGNLCYRYDPARAERAGHYLIVWSKQCRVMNWNMLMR